MNTASIIVDGLAFFGICLFIWKAISEEREINYKKHLKTGMPIIYYEGVENRRGVVIDPGKISTIVRDTFTMKIKRVFTSEIYKPWL